MTGDDAVAAMRAALNDRGRANVIRLVCSPHCQHGELCHGDNLAALARELIGASDERARAAGSRKTAAGDPGRPSAPKQPRKVRSDKGVRRGPSGPRRLKGVGALAALDS